MMDIAISKKDQNDLQNDYKKGLSGIHEKVHEKVHEHSAFSIPKKRQTAQKVVTKLHCCFSETWRVTMTEKNVVKKRIRKCQR